MNNLENQIFSIESDIYVNDIVKADIVVKTAPYVHQRRSPVYENLFTIFYKLSGTSYITINDTENSSVNEGILFLPKGFYEYGSRSDKDTNNFYQIYFTGNYPERVDNNFFSRPHGITNAQNLRHLIEKICNCFASKPLGYKTEAKKNLYSLLNAIMVQSMSEKNNSTGYYNIKKAVKYLEENFMKSDINVEQLAALSNISPVYFTNIFKEFYGVTPKSYIINLKLEHAKELLLSAHHSVVEISELVGYSDPAYFSTAFKKFYGYTPSEYKNMYRNKG